MRSQSRNLVFFLAGALWILSLKICPCTWARLNGESEGYPPGYAVRGPQGLFAIGGDQTFIHDAGLLKLRISNIGTMGNRYEPDEFGATWRGGEYLYVSGLWIGAVGSDSQKHVSTAQYDTELLPEIDRRWTIYESFEGVEGGARATAFEPNGGDDDGDGEVNEDFHDGFDNDGDGQYDEDYEAISSQMFSCTYRDDTPEVLANNTEHVPLNLLIRQRSFQWSSPTLNEFVGFEFEIVNTGDQSLERLHLGFFSDSDAGPRSNPKYFSDDLVGWTHVDTVVYDQYESPPCDFHRVAFDAAYMWDAVDDGNQAQGGDVPGVFGSLFLGHTTDPAGIRAPTRVGLNTVAWFSAQGEETDPQDDIERYNLMSRGTKPSRPAGKPRDYRYVISAGEFARLEPGESLVFQTAYVIGDGFKDFNQNAARAQRVFDGVFVDADGLANTGISGRELCLQVLEDGEPIFWKDDCDTSNLFPETHEIRLPGPCVYVDDDCDPCTANGGREHRINWAGITPPPSPIVEIVPGDQSSTLKWDNSPENSVNFFTGEIFFSGYEIWRCDTWKRPKGSLGPDAVEFMKIMTLWYENENLGIHPPSYFLTDSPHSQLLANYVNEEVGEYAPPQFKLFPPGLYEFTDDRGMVNGFTTFFVVTAFAVQLNESGIPTILGRVPSAMESQAVLGRANAQENVDCDQIYVVPNPYRGSAAWDLIPSDNDPTGTKIGIVGLPTGTSTIRIYTMAGDLVKTHVHEETAINGGTYWWNLITESGQGSVSGVYLFTVEHSGGTCRGKFIIIR